MSASDAAFNDAAFAVKELNLLGAPRGVTYVDELSGEPAKYAASLGDKLVYYYMSPAAARLDYEGILKQISPLLAQLSATESAPASTTAERASQLRRVRALQREIADACARRAQELLLAQHFELALPSAMRGLRALMALHGEGSVELVPAYLVLAEVNINMASIGLTRVAPDDYLSAANFILVQHPEASALLRARLHRNFGRMHTSRGDNAAARASFARDVFYNAMVYGPESIEVSVGLFFMAQIMAAEGEPGAALFFDRVVDAWRRRLSGARSPVSLALAIDFEAASPEARLGGVSASAILNGRPPQVPPREAAAAEAAAPFGAGAPATPVPLSEPHLREGVEILAHIARLRAAAAGASHASVAEVREVLALVLQQGGREEEARAILAEAPLAGGFGAIKT